MAPHPKKVLTSISMMKKGPGRHADGEGLYLVVDDSGARRWALRTVVRGKRCEIGLGRARPNNLAEARLKAQQMRDVARAGGDPVAERAAKKAAERAISVTFEEYATDYIAAHRPEWKNAKHAAQWTSSLVEHAYPKIGPVAIGRVDRPMIVSILRPIWRRLRRRHRVCAAGFRPFSTRRKRTNCAWATTRRSGLEASKRPFHVIGARSASFTMPRCPTTPWRRFWSIEGAARDCRSRARVRHPDGCQDRRDDRRKVGRDRLRRPRLERAGRAHESWQAAPRSA